MLDRRPVARMFRLEFIEPIIIDPDSCWFGYFTAAAKFIAAEPA